MGERKQLSRLSYFFLVLQILRKQVIQLSPVHIPSMPYDIASFHAL